MSHNYNNIIQNKNYKYCDCKKYHMIKNNTKSDIQCNCGKTRVQLKYSNKDKCCSHIAGFHINNLPYNKQVHQLLKKIYVNNNHIKLHNKYKPTTDDIILLTSYYNKHKNTIIRYLFLGNDTKHSPNIKCIYKHTENKIYLITYKKLL
jgi:hypothetical protein